MRKFISIITLSIISLAHDGFISTEYTSLKYGEKPINNFASLYAKYNHKEGFFDGNLEFKGAITGHGILQKSDDFDYFESVEDSKGLVHSLCLDYYPTSSLMLSAGRELLNLNLLNGSFDGAMAVGNFDDFNIKAFYFNRYTLLLPSYYQDREFEEHLTGVNMAYNKGVFDSEFSYFTYDKNDVTDLYMALVLDAFILGAEHLSFQSDNFQNEGAYKLHAGYRYKNFYVEGGYYSVYDGKLHNIYALGGTTFKRFGLNSFLNQEEAENIYGDLVYNHRMFYGKLHLGETKFKENKTEEAKGVEAGVSLSLRYKDMEAMVSYLIQEPEQSDSTKKRTQWVQTNLKYRF